MSKIVTISKRFRLVFTFVLVILGVVVGNQASNLYFVNLSRHLHGKATWLRLFIPEDATPPSNSDKIWLQIFFIVVGALLGFVLEMLIFQQFMKARKKWNEMTPQDKVVLYVGLIVGLLLAALFRSVLGIEPWISVVVAILLCYGSILALDNVKEQFQVFFPNSVPVIKGEHYGTYRPKLLDTNVIIDGRVADISRAGFIEGPIYIPKFVLEELQQIADSSDSLKRARGRRGLDILHQMQNELDLQVPEFAIDDPKEEVDARLVRAAKDVGGAIVTNDYNLNRVAELQGVDVLNINELANAVKPVVLPGEEMRVTIIREGKEKEQGIGYLDDGTMIVVEGARRMIGYTLGISVTSVLQTVQGKMIFGKVKDDEELEEPEIDENIRSYTGGRPRRKVR